MTTLNHCNRLECSQIVESLNVELRRQHEEIESYKRVLRRLTEEKQEAHEALRVALGALESEDCINVLMQDAITKIREVL